jgi:hypothetical protein
MQNNKIQLNIPASLVANAEEIRAVIYGRLGNILISIGLVTPKDEVMRGDFSLAFPIEEAQKFNIWTRSGDKWKIALHGVPQILILGNGDKVLELNDRPQSINLVNKVAQITQADADFANGVLGDRVVSPTEPTLAQKAKSLGSSMSDWAKAGFSMASTETLESRLAICKGCEFWDAAGFGGTGKCSKCGCSTQAKLRMATSACPLDPPKWTAQ